MLQTIKLGTGGVGGHGSNSFNHTGQSTDEFSVGLDLREGRHINIDIHVPLEDDVEVGIGDGKLITYKVLVTVEQVLGEVVKLAKYDLELSLSGCTFQTIKQWAVQGMNFTSQKVKDVLHLVPLHGAVLGSNLTRSLFATKLELSRELPDQRRIEAWPHFH